MSSKGQHLIAAAHTQRVRQLYKTVLKLHRGLPTELKALGNQYAKDEFRRHKTANQEQTQTFMIEWTNYAINLTKQLGMRGVHLAKPLGTTIAEAELDKFSEEQLRQLHSLYEEVIKPIDERS